MESKIFDALSFISNPDTRDVIVCGLSVGFIAGFTAGFVFSKFFFLFLRDAWRTFRGWRAAKRAERDYQERQSRKKEKDIAIDTAMRGLLYSSDGLLEDESRNLYCPRCVSEGIRSILAKERERIYCRECGHCVNPWN